MPPPDLTGVRLDVCSVHPSRGLGKNGIPFAVKRNFQLHDDSRERVILYRAGDSLSSAQIKRLDALDDRRFLETNIFRRTPWKHPFYRSAARPEQFPKPSQIDSFGHI